MTTLEKSSSIAGIVSAVLAAVGIVWGVWTYIQPPASPQSIAPTGNLGVDPKVLQQMELDAARSKRFMEAWEATNYELSSITRALNDKEMKVYDAAAQKLRDAMHLAELGGRDEDALQLYREAREMFKRLR